MDIQDVKSIIEQNENSKFALQSFITKTEKVFTFPGLNENNLRLQLWNSLFIIASTTLDEETQAKCFSAIRILSREKTLLDQLLQARDWLNLIKKSSGLDDINKEFTENSKNVAIEAEKCLCNIVFNCRKAAKECQDNDILYNINDRIKYYSKPSFPEEIKFFDMKLLFIITAVLPGTRTPLRDEKMAAINLMEFLGTISVEEESLKGSSADLACEILKALFNLTVHIQPSEEHKENFKKLVKILRKYLILPVESNEKRLALHNDVVNLLTNIPNIFYAELVPCLGFTDSENKIEQMEYCGHDVAALKEILELLEAKIAVDNPVGRQLEVISPTATVLYKGACANKLIRKYLRSQILPPLEDIFSRPEEGTTLRNCLCRLLTTPVTELRDIIAEFLFVLCKKSVKRMIKYTGYGNAAGLFAQRGLLGGKEDDEAAEYSSDSEDSETEEYAVNKHKINPVLGCYEPAHPDAMAGMTDEQKEYEAMKIVNLMDAMTRTGTIKPCRIDKNGKPVPIEHVLELQNSMKNNEICKKSK